MNLSVPCPFLQCEIFDELVLGLRKSRCRKLPRALKEWQAFLDLKKTIDDFSECCPLLELMSNKAMMARHWKRITDLTRHNFDVENETFKLRNIMEAPLLKYKEEIEVFMTTGLRWA